MEVVHRGKAKRIVGRWLLPGFPSGILHAVRNCGFPDLAVEPMGLDYQLTDRAIRFATTGNVEFAEGLAVLRAGFQAARNTCAAPHWGLLFDIRHSSENRSPDELRSIAEIIARHRDVLTGRCAVVAGDPLHYGLARMFGVFMDGLGLEVFVFTKLDEAEQWLHGGSATT